MTFFMYMVRCRDTGQVLYVGQGSLQRATKPFSKTVRKITAALGYTPEMRTENCYPTRGEALDLEEKLIARYNPPYNVTRRGSVQTGVKHTVEWNKNISAGLRGHKFTSERRENISRALRGRKQSLEQRAASATGLRAMYARRRLEA